MFPPDAICRRPAPPERVSQLICPPRLSDSPCSLATTSDDGDDDGAQVSTPESAGWVIAVIVVVVLVIGGVISTVCYVHFRNKRRKRAREQRRTARRARAAHPHHRPRASRRSHSSSSSASEESTFSEDTVVMQYPAAAVTRPEAYKYAYGYADVGRADKYEDERFEMAQPK
ncbi:uncharacterized protein LAESUDRAFT_510361 [Laetiporus sulphureus 93-53]|uniref:Uncharacterized protein n=1 Tax=Laetiporus sulphureus 93-53 TaxID=1314785 RepID=A0A165FXV0_9APHY|nr:uncharacterized protein LAESUDRAFT_510361 [Laetiporus sulphureus 93-53]KZT09559.1 hypothetical protein LAESUDRAFT_510361 [Laetiporus sulphureus 93-53]